MRQFGKTQKRAVCKITFGVRAESQNKIFIPVFCVEIPVEKLNICFKLPSNRSWLCKSSRCLGQLCCRCFSLHEPVSMSYGTAKTLTSTSLEQHILPFLVTQSPAGTVQQTISCLSIRILGTKSQMYLKDASQERGCTYVNLFSSIFCSCWRFVIG